MPRTSNLSNKSKYPFKLFFSMFRCLSDVKESNESGNLVKLLALKNKYFKFFKNPIDSGSAVKLLFPR